MMSVTTGTGRRWLGLVVAMALAAPSADACDDLLRADRKVELPSSPDQVFSCPIYPWLDPDSPITNPGLAPLLFYQSRCGSGPILLVRRTDTIELTGGGDCLPLTTASGCLPLGGLSGDTVQDTWRFAAATAGTRVRLRVDVISDNPGCGAVPRTSCAVAPDPLRGPLDPKLAIFEPGVVPVPGPFNGFRSPVDCAVAVTGDVGCQGPGRDPTRDCLVCDNLDCTLGASRLGACATLDLTLPVAGDWTIAVAPQAPAIVAESEGCYQLTVEALGGATVGPLTLVVDDQAVTFLHRQ